MDSQQWMAFHCGMHLLRGRPNADVSGVEVIFDDRRRAVVKDERYWPNQAAPLLTVFLPARFAALSSAEFNNGMDDIDSVVATAVWDAITNTPDLERRCPHCRKPLES